MAKGFALPSVYNSISVSKKNKEEAKMCMKALSESYTWQCHLPEYVWSEFISQGNLLAREVINVFIHLF